MRSLLLILAILGIATHAYAGSSTGYTPNHTTVNTMGGSATNAALMPGDSGTVLHFTANNYVAGAATLTPQIGPVLTVNGTLPKTNVTGTYRYKWALGQFSDTAYLSGPINPFGLTGTSNFYCCVAYQNQMAVNTGFGQPQILNDGKDNSQGTYLNTCNKSPATANCASVDVSGGSLKDSIIGSKNVTGYYSLNVQCGGLASNGTQLCFKKNKAATTCVSVPNAMVTNTTYPLTIGRYAAATGYSFPGLIYEVKCSTLPATDANMTADINAVLRPSMMVALGDSMTASGGMAPTYPQGVENNLAGGYTVMNAGIGGSTTTDMDSRWTSDIRGNGFSAVSMLGGINDIAQGDGGATTTSTIETNLQTVYDQGRTDGMKVIPVTILPFKGSTFGWWSAVNQSVEDSVNSSIASYATTNTLAYVDAYAAFGKPGDPQSANPSLVGSDFTHPNQTGYNLLATLVAAAVNGNNTQVGTVSLTSGAATVTFSPAFSSTPTCTCVDQTAAHTQTCTPSATQLVITGGTGTDSIKWQCIGHT